MKTKFKEIEHLIDLSEIAFPDMSDGKRELLRLVLAKAYEAGRASQLADLMAEQRRMRTEMAMIRMARWKHEKQLNN